MDLSRRKLGALIYDAAMSSRVTVADPFCPVLAKSRTPPSGFVVLVGAIVRGLLDL